MTDRYLDAAADCTKATDLDPAYVKAWVRLGTAYDHLAESANSLDSYEKALAALPKENLTPTDLKLREQAQAGAKAAKERLEPKSQKVHHVVALPPAQGKLPWDRAEGLVNERLAKYGHTMECANSSAWSMYRAYTQWKEGVDGMKQMKEIKGPQAGMFVRIGVIENLSNAILQDDRVFHVEGQPFIDLYNKQAAAESMQTGAWAHAGPQQIFTEALEMQRTKGWDAVKQALSTTVRAYIMRGFMETGLRGRADVGVEFIGKAIEIIEWGRQVWRNVRKEDRGVIFEETFLRGVQSLHLETYMKAYEEHPGLDAKYSLEELLQHAQDILKGLDGQAYINDVDPGFFLGFFVYPKARALAMVGFYHAQMAQYVDNNDHAAVIKHRKLAAAAYHTAGIAYPPDDENHAWYLRCSLNYMYISGTPVREILKTTEAIRNAIPEMKKLWEYSSLAMGGRDQKLEQTRQEEQRLRAGLRGGSITMDTLLMNGPP
ncbi:hypothetical protein EIP86_009852 [Pleurotus ostreatoroseus]|nr:hypothetical protein EIP86_009852 [Pleurotus ostreatoroseus]